jgi:hypothetical protein
MKRTNEEIVLQIRALLDELGGEDATNFYPKKQGVVTSAKKGPIGCAGAIESLVDEGFFENLKEVVQVAEKLKEEGQPYSRELISMNLLNFVKPPKKILRRVREGGKWQYIIRK